MQKPCFSQEESPLPGTCGEREPHVLEGSIQGWSLHLAELEGGEEGMFLVQIWQTLVFVAKVL